VHYVYLPDACEQVNKNKTECYTMVYNLGNKIYLVFEISTNRANKLSRNYELHFTRF